MNRTSKILYFIISVIFFTVFDRYFSELLVKSVFKVPENPVFDLIYAQNTGAAFSLFENYRLFLIIFAVLAILMIIIYGIRNAEKYTVFAVFWCSMLISGIGCNLFERITFGYVRDFFKLNFIDFPIFNISDIFITVGVTALVFLIIKNKYLKNENNN